MKTQHIWRILILFLTIAIGGWLFYSNHKGVNGTEVSINNKKMSFADFLENNTEPYKCVVQYPAGQNNRGMNVTFYIASKMIHGEYASPYTNENITFIIRDGSYYVWIAASSTGSVISIPYDPTGKPSGEVYHSYIQSAGNYDCNPWEAVPSVFDIPQTIEFKSSSQV